MTTTQYTVIYYDTTGVGETIRFLLSYGGQKFVDVRYSLEEWTAIQPTTPFGCLPLIEINGNRYYQILAISRYLAKKFDLAGTTDEERLEIDSLTETLNDYRLPISFYFWEADPNKKTERGAIMKTKIEFFLGKFETIVRENGGYFHNNKLSWPDLMFTAQQDYVDFVAGYETAKDYPHLKQLMEKVLAIPAIKEWVQKRPTSCCLREYRNAHQEKPVIE